MANLTNSNQWDNLTCDLLDRILSLLQKDNEHHLDAESIQKKLGISDDAKGSNSLFVEKCIEILKNDMRISSENDYNWTILPPGIGFSYVEEKSKVEAEIKKEKQARLDFETSSTKRNRLQMWYLTIIAIISIYGAILSTLQWFAK